VADGNPDWQRTSDGAADDRGVVKFEAEELGGFSADELAGDGRDGQREIRVHGDGAGGGDGGGDGGGGEVEVVVGEVQRGPAERDGEVVVGEAERHDDAPAGDIYDELTNADFGGSDDGEVVVVNYEDRLVEALPDLARLAALAGVRVAAEGLRLGLRASARIARASVDPDAATQLAHDIGSSARSHARDFLGVTELEERVRRLTPVGDRFSADGAGPQRDGERQESVRPDVLLRAQGAELLRQSADVNTDDHLHPAFGRILGELAPDEGRILRLLTYEGPQPVVDVRAANLIGVGSQLVAEKLNMIGMAAGCRHGDRVPAYLTNLQRLGLVCFSDTPLGDEITYQVLEAQPHVLEAIKSASRAKSIQRSLRLTPFGEEFCCACFPREYDEVQDLSRGRIRGTLGGERDGDLADVHAALDEVELEVIGDDGDVVHDADVVEEAGPEG
jgi:hypothetical protein